MQKGHALIFLLVGVFILAVLGGAFYLGKSTIAKPSPVPVVTSQTPQPTSATKTPPTSDETANWKVYNDQKYNFSFQHPDLKECCKISGPVGDANLVVTLADNNTVTQGTDKPFNGLAVYVVNRNISGEEGFNSYIYYQKNALLDQYKAFTGEQPKQTGSEKTVVVADRQGVSLKGFSWDNIERIYVPFPDNQKVLVIAKSQTSGGNFETIFNNILSTFKFLDQKQNSNQNTQTDNSSTAKKLVYNLPATWQTAKDTTGKLEIGYDPSSYNPNSLQSRIDLNSKACCSSIVFKLLPYDGSSRHQFISKNTGAIKLSNTLEKEYLIEGKSALFQYNVDFSGNSTVGVIVVDNSQAVLIESQSGDPKLIEKILSTFKFTP